MAINTALIQGAATAAGPVVDYFGSFSQGFDSTFEPLMEMAKLKLLEEKEKKHPLLASLQEGSGRDLVNSDLENLR